MENKKAASDQGLPLAWLFVLVFAAAALITAALLYFYSTQKTIVRKRIIDNLEMMVDYKGTLIKRWYVRLKGRCPPRQNSSDHPGSRQKRAAEGSVRQGEL